MREDRWPPGSPRTSRAARSEGSTVPWPRGRRWPCTRATGRRAPWSPPSLASPWSCPWVALVVRREQPAPGDMRVALGGGETGVAQEFLHAADVGSPFEQMGGERVPESMRRDAPVRHHPPPVSLDHGPD